LQFGLKDVSELPSLKEFEEIRRVAFADSEPAAAVEEAVPAEEAPVETPAEPAPEATPGEREN
jgi:segregation and condensation protein B